MLLRAMAGPYAGQVRDYTYEAGRAALTAGFAEPVATHDVPASLLALVRPAIADATQTPPPIPARRRSPGRR